MRATEEKKMGMAAPPAAIDKPYNIGRATASHPGVTLSRNETEKKGKRKDVIQVAYDADGANWVAC